MDEFVPSAFSQHSNTVPPDILYHYTDQGGLLGIVEKAELWGTKLQYMNDATEFGLALSMARQALDSMIKTSMASEKKAACLKLRQSLSGLEAINIFAVCFCEEGDSLSQWRGYAGGHQGYSIGFASPALAQAASCKHFNLKKCIYDSDIQLSIVNQAIEYCIQEELAIPSRTQWGFHGPLAEILFRCGAFFKDPSFRDENEWRLISPTVAFRDAEVAFRVGRSIIMPYYVLPISCRTVSSYGLSKIGSHDVADAKWYVRPFAGAADCVRIKNTVPKLVTAHFAHRNSATSARF
jgi:hypothetical protein